MASRKPSTKPRHSVQLFIAAAVTVAGVVLLLLGFYSAPVGEIHSSVLVAAGEVFTFAGSVLGIDYHYKVRGNSN